MSQGQAEPWEILQVESCSHQRYSSLVPQSLEIWCCLETRSLQMQSSCSDLQQGLKQWLVSALPGRFKHQDFFLSPSHLWDLMLEMINLLEEKFILALGVKGFQSMFSWSCHFGLWGQVSQPCRARNPGSWNPRIACSPGREWDPNKGVTALFQWGAVSTAKPLHLV